jgi:hypothetical protein
MYNPQIITKLHRINDTIGITSKWQSNFPYPRAQAFQWFGNVSLASIGRNRQCSKANRLCSVWKFLKFLAGSIDS